MEQVKVVLAILKKYHFWILALLILVLAVFLYRSASDDLKKQFDSRKKVIENAMKQATSVSSDSNHPNQKRIENWKKLHDAQRHEVLDGWVLLYRNQKKNNPWPLVLSKRFRMAVQELGLFDEISQVDREEYWFFIKKELPQLYKIVNFRHQVDQDGNPIESTVSSSTSGRGRNPAPRGAAQSADANWVGVVDWDRMDRARIGTEFEFESAPSSLQIRLTQENYWVYRALATIIQKTNGEVKTQSAAAVKAIRAMEIGQTASASFAADRGANLFLQSDGEEDDFEAEGAGGESMLDGVELSEADMAYLEKRYVEENLAPLPAGDQPYAEFKMMPILLRLKIDQRKIPDLLVECANSAMPVEVRHLRISPEKAMHVELANPEEQSTGVPEIKWTSGTSGALGGGASRGGSVGGYNAGSGGGSGVAQETASPNDVEIEIRGIIYIYNPPDLEKLATGAVSEATIEQGNATEAEETAASEETEEEESDETSSEQSDETTPEEGEPVDGSSNASLEEKATTD